MPRLDEFMAARKAGRPFSLQRVALWTASVFIFIGLVPQPIRYLLSPAAIVRNQTSGTIRVTLVGNTGDADRTVLHRVHPISLGPASSRLPVAPGETLTIAYDQGEDDDLTLTISELVIEDEEGMTKMMLAPRDPHGVTSLSSMVFRVTPGGSLSGLSQEVGRALARNQEPSPLISAIGLGLLFAAIGTMAYLVLDRKSESPSKRE